MNLPTKPRQNREIVLQTIIDLCEHNHGASRTRVVANCGLKPPIVDEHIKNLKADGVIRALYNGVYEPIDQTIDRRVSATSLTHGRLKVEIGDELLTLTPREAFSLAKLLAGILLAFRAS